MIENAERICQGPGRKPTDILKPTHNRSGRQKSLVLNGNLDGNWVQALADTGSDYNIISEGFATRKGIRIRRNLTNGKVQIQLANGSHVYSVGQVIASWTFDNEQQEVKILFHVLGQCTSDVIIGGLTLYETKTLTTYASRISRQVLPTSQAFDVNFLSTPQKLLRGSIHCQEVFAVPDTGSQRNIISVECAQALRLWVRCESSVWLRFPDGSVTRTLGSVWASWKMSYRSKSFPVLWDILPGFPQTALIGGEVLYRKRIYTKYAECFVNAGCASHLPRLYTITYDSHKDKNAKKPPVDGVYNRELSRELGRLTMTFDESVCIHEDQVGVIKKVGFSKEEFLALALANEKCRDDNSTEEVNQQWHFNQEIGEHSEASQEELVKIEIKRREIVFEELQRQQDCYSAIWRLPDADKQRATAEEKERQDIESLICRKRIAAIALQIQDNAIQNQIRQQRLANEEANLRGKQMRLENIRVEIDNLRGELQQLKGNRFNIHRRARQKVHAAEIEDAKRRLEELSSQKAQLELTQ